MTKGIQFDDHGNMSAINIPADNLPEALHELIGCAIAIPLNIRSGMKLWVDELGEDNNAHPNAALSRLVAEYGLDFPIYGQGIFLGSTEDRSETAPVLGLTNDDRVSIVLTHCRLERALLNA